MIRVCQQLASIVLIVQYVEHSVLLLAVLLFQIYRYVNQILLCFLFCSVYSLLHGVLCCKQTCTVTVIHYYSDDRQLLIAVVPAVIGPIAIRYWPRIAICAYLTCIRRQNTAIMFGMEKLEQCGYPTVKKVEDMFIRFDRIHERDRRTDRRTDGQTRMTAGRSYAQRCAAKIHSISVSTERCRSLVYSLAANQDTQCNRCC